MLITFVIYSKIVSRIQVFVELLVNIPVYAYVCMLTNNKLLEYNEDHFKSKLSFVILISFISNNTRQVLTFVKKERNNSSMLLELRLHRKSHCCIYKYVVCVPLH